MLNKSLEITEVPHNQYNNGLLYNLCKNVGKNSKILLTGNGADEIFFGYNGDERHLLYSKLFFLPFKIMANLNINIFKNYINYSKNRFQNQIFLKKNVEKNDYNILENDFKNSNYEDLLDLKFYLSLFVKSENNNLVNPDIIGLKNNVEIRSPFLDHRIVSFAASLPHKYKIKSMFSNYGNKFLPKEYVNKVMPKGLIKKEKRGFGWNFDMNNLIHKKIFKKNYFDHFEDFNLNKNYFIKISEEFGKQLKNNMHPDTNISRFFYNSIMLSKWIKKL